MTRDEWLRHEKARIESGLTKQSYCRKTGIKPHILSYYRKKYRLASEPEPKLAEVILDDPPSSERFFITMEFSDQGTVRFHGHAESFMVFQKKS